MRYAILTDIHGNLEALEAVLTKIDEITQENPIDQIWFLGDLVGYGPNPNECITTLRERTDVIIAGNHDWAAIGKIDLEDFSDVARTSAEWTTEQLTEEHRTFLTNLPERVDIGDCTLVHGSPYGPLWEYLTSSILAERSFQYFHNRYCVVGHTHVPIIFQQPPTSRLLPVISQKDAEETNNGNSVSSSENYLTAEIPLAAITSGTCTSKTAAESESAFEDPDTHQTLTEEDANAILEAHHMPDAEYSRESIGDVTPAEAISGEENIVLADEAIHDDTDKAAQDAEDEHKVTSQDKLLSAEEHLNAEIEELLTLLGLSQDVIQVTNEMLVPPEGHWQVPDGYRAIINPGGVGQPRDGDPRAAFMVYDTEHGFEFYRVPYPFEKTQEKIIKAGLPSYLAIRLAHGR